MNKGKAVIVLLVIVLALAGVSYIDIFGIDGKGKASASDISLGLDLAGGVSITYQVVGEDILHPTAVEEMTSGDFDLTLFTCNYGSSRRITVYCERVK